MSTQVSSNLLPRIADSRPARKPMTWWICANAFTGRSGRGWIRVWTAQRPQPNSYPLLRAAVRR